MLKKITGSWFEFTHHNIAEGKYWNPICRRFTGEQWREKIREMHSLGMKYIVLLGSAFEDENTAEAYFETNLYPLAKDFTCPNPIEMILDEAEKLDMKLFMSVGFYGNWKKPHLNITSSQVKARAFQAMEELYAKYGHYKSFYGWYYPDEAYIGGHYNEEFIKYCNEYSAFGRSIDKRFKSLIAPYGTKMVIADDKYIKQLENMDVDIIAYQDEVGVHKSTPDQTGAYYQALRTVHDKAARSVLWADMEIFDFEGEVYRSALIPSNMDRVSKQIEAISPFADEILCYQYMGMMNKPGTNAYCGHPDSIEFYIQYKNYIDQKGL